MNKIFRTMGEGISPKNSASHMYKGMPPIRKNGIDDELYKEILYLLKILKLRNKEVAAHYTDMKNSIGSIKVGQSKKHYHQDPTYKWLKEEMESKGFPAKWNAMKQLMEV